MGKGFAIFILILIVGAIIYALFINKALSAKILPYLPYSVAKSIVPFVSPGYVLFYASGLNNITNCVWNVEYNGTNASSSGIPCSSAAFFNMSKTGSYKAYFFLLLVSPSKQLIKLEPPSLLNEITSSVSLCAQSLFSGKAYYIYYSTSSGNTFSTGNAYLINYSSKLINCTVS